MKVVAYVTMTLNIFFWFIIKNRNPETEPLWSRADSGRGQEGAKRFKLFGNSFWKVKMVTLIFFHFKMGVHPVHPHPTPGYSPDEVDP